MAVNLITQEDLQQFKMELLAEIKELMKPLNAATSKRWLKSYQVREILGGISRGTLQTMTDNGTLPGSLVGGLLFYDYDEIVQLMKKNKLGKRHG